MEHDNRRLTFWFDFASPYSYLTAMRIDAAAAVAGVPVDWQPFLLGPTFAAQGWPTSPFNSHPLKGAYMRRDVARLAQARGLPFVMPKVFPARSLRAARVAIAVGEPGRGPDGRAAISKAILTAGFGRGEDTADGDVLAACILSLSLDPAEVFHRAVEPELKARLRRVTECAQSLGIFGAPSFTAPDGELFWGDDRLEAALHWTANL